MLTVTVRLPRKVSDKCHSSHSVAEFPQVYVLCVCIGRGNGKLGRCRTILIFKPLGDFFLGVHAATQRSLCMQYNVSRPLLCDCVPLQKSLL